MLFDIVATLGGVATATLGGVAVSTLGGAAPGGGVGVCLPIILVSLRIAARCLIFAAAEAGNVRPSCSKRLAAAWSV
jgi:hypothetical protein